MAARKRSEIAAAEATASAPTTSAAERTVPLPHVDTASNRLPMENDFSAMCIRLKTQKGFKVPLSEVAHWEPQQRHIVAMWLERMTDDVPGVLATYPRTAEVPTEPDSHFDGAAPPQLDLVGHARRVESKSASPAAERPIVPLSRPITHTLTIMVPEDSYSPIQYNNFRVGGFSATVSVDTGQDPVAIARGILNQLHALYDEEFERKSAKFVANLRGVKAKLGVA